MAGMEKASSGFVEEGAVGGGTGMICLGFQRRYRYCIKSDR
jgi:L-aminopeptidase/D-esterase-like protein